MSESPTWQRGGTDLQGELRQGPRREPSEGAHGTAREEQSRSWWSGVREDVKFSLRTIRRRPGFASAVVLVLALGIGAFTTVLSVVDTVLLRPLALPDSERLMLVWGRSEATPESWLSYPEYVDLQEQVRGFESVAALRDVRYTVSGDSEAEEVSGLGVSANLFPTLRTGTALGRTFLPTEDQPNAEKVVLLSHGFWQRRFGGDPGVLGGSITMDGEPYTVVGVLPRGFRLLPPSSVFPERVDVWLPLEATLIAPFRRDRTVRLLHVLGRLQPDASVEQAQSALNATAVAFQQEHPAAYPEPGWGLRVVPFQEQIVRGARPALLVLLIAVSLLLLVVCANLSSLVLARNAARSQEMATRMALGAGHTRLAQQLFTEALVLALVGGALGFVLAAGGLAWLRSLDLSSVPRLEEVGLQTNVFFFAVAVVLLTSALFGLLPALQYTRRPPAASLRAASRGLTESWSDGRLRRVLVVGQLATAMVLLIATALLGRSLLHLQQAPLGFDPENVVTTRVSLSPHRFADGPERVRFLDDLLRAIGERPEVRSAGAVTQLPLSGAFLASGFAPEGAVAPADTQLTADLRGVTPEYFRTMGIPILAGRAFTARDEAGAPAVAIVDRTMADRLWPGESAVGKRIRWTRGGTWLEVVGVAAPVKHYAVADPPHETVYRPYAQYSFIPSLYLTVRGSAEPAVLAAVRQELDRLAPDHALADVRTMSGRVSDSIAPMRFHTLLLGIFAVAALLLASIGVFGIVAYSVGRRTREIGIRMAVGAQPKSVLWLVVWQSLLLIGVGVGAGIVVAAAFSRVLESQLYGVSPADPLVYVLVPLLLLGMAGIAALVPASRATRVDPKVALQSE